MNTSTYEISNDPETIRQWGDRVILLTNEQAARLDAMSRAERRDWMRRNGLFKGPRP